MKHILTSANKTRENHRVLCSYSRRERWHPVLSDNIDLLAKQSLTANRSSFYHHTLSGHLANAASELMKLDHEEPQLTEPYLSKQKKLMVRWCKTSSQVNISTKYLLNIYLLCDH